MLGKEAEGREREAKSRCRDLRVGTVGRVAGEERQVATTVKETDATCTHHCQHAAAAGAAGAGGAPCSRRMTRLLLHGHAAAAAGADADCNGSSSQG